MSTTTGHRPKTAPVGHASASPPPLPRVTPDLVARCLLTGPAVWVAAVVSGVVGLAVGIGLACEVFGGWWHVELPCSCPWQKRALAFGIASAFAILGAALVSAWFASRGPPGTFAGTAGGMAGLVATDALFDAMGPLAFLASAAIAGLTCLAVSIRPRATRVREAALPPERAP